MIMTLIVMRRSSCVLLPNDFFEHDLDVDVEVGDEEVICTTLHEAVQVLAQWLVLVMCACVWRWIVD